jgi:ribosomal protein L11 methyltransferase
VVIHIDPGVAFGSGLHESTRLCLSVLEDTVTPGCSVIDFGAGSGVLAIAAAKLGGGRVIAIEGDEESSGVAAENVKRNEVEGVVRVIWSDRPEAGEILADLITANITPNVINENLPGLVSALRSGGTIVMSGMTVKNCHEVKDVLPQSGLVLRDQVSEGDWVALVAVKPGSGVDR